jgi:hypothetical protein
MSPPGALECPAFESSNPPPTEEPSPRLPTYDWEEPHPGHRLSLSNEMGFQLVRSASAGFDGGMAAKGRTQPDLSHGRRTTPRKLRAKSRNNVPLPIEILNDIPNDNDIKSAPLPLTRTIPFPSPVDLAAKMSSLPNVATKVLEVDIDSETEIGTACEYTTGYQKDTTAVSPRLAISLCDVSNLLGITLGNSQANADVTVVNPELCCHATADEDIYGWEAELEKKLHVNNTSQESVDTYVCDRPYKYQRSSGGKRGLLQRVFSINHPRDVAVQVRQPS